MSIWSRLFGGASTELPEHEMPSVADAATEGLAMAEMAAVMTLKNRILVTAHVGQAAFDTERFERELQEILESLALEQDQAAALVRNERRTAATLKGRPVHQHDYRQIDLQKLRLRELASEQTAKRIREKRVDVNWLRSHVEKARDDAWAELAREMERSLDRAAETEFGGPDYEIGRDDRLRQFVTVDLFRLQLDAQRSASGPSNESASQAGGEGY